VGSRGSRLIPLRVTGTASGLSQLIVAPVTRADSGLDKVLLHEGGNLPAAEPRRAVISTSREPAALTRTPYVYAVPFLTHLAENDIVAINPNGRVDTLFRDGALDNALFVTDRCNSNCLMCSQPPKDIDDLDYHFDINSKLVRLIPKTTPVLGITGGEPTLLGARFLALLRLLHSELPETEVHILTNGRSFAWQNVVQAVARAASSKVVFGIPLYADHHILHDYVVQATNAFAQTVLGLHNLARNNIRVEIRVVLHKQTYQRLPALARFIHRNLPFVEHIALMGLEDTGYARHNNEILWMEPADYVNELSDAVHYLSAFGFGVSIYNLQLCLLPESLWGYCRSSISQWKREYIDECGKCDVAGRCGGVFGTSRRVSSRIKAIILPN
jgi:His-Xaa-Ser system radical SAM maturase HxsC